MMPPNNYGFSEKFAFIQDRYGVSWQLNLPSQ
jgi:predicted 3-demethylubiquinone-9 3-methyltransferase (glyoxalase superfamily)